jgi:hypothetical protein
VSRVYHAYGLTIRVPFACPALTEPDADAAGACDGPGADCGGPSAVSEAGADCGAPGAVSEAGAGAADDLIVREQPVPRQLPAPQAGEASWEAAPGAFLVRGGPRAGRFLAEAGSVTFERGPRCDDVVLARCFTDRVLPAVLRQRGLLVLHANAVATDGGVIVIGGESGTGKSTTLAALLDRGCRMLSDDVTALRPGAAPGLVEVVPGAAQTHLTADAAGGLGYAVDPAQLQPWRRMKAAISTHGGMASRAGRLRALYLLRLSPGDDVVVTAAAGGAKFRALQDCLYGPMFTEEHPALFPLMSTVAATVPFFLLERPAGRWSVGEVADAILGGAAEPAPQTLPQPVP